MPKKLPGIPVQLDAFGHVADGPTLYVLPDSSRRDESELPILMIQYVLPRNAEAIPISFALKPTCVKTHNIAVWDQPALFPAVVWIGVASSVCLVFEVETDREDFLRKVRLRLTFELRLDRDCHESFFIRMESPDGRVAEAYHSKGAVQEIMSRPLKYPAITLLDETWTMTPRILPYKECVRRVSLRDSFLAIQASEANDEQYFYVIYCNTALSTKQLYGIVRARKSILICLQPNAMIIWRFQLRPPSTAVMLVRDFVDGSSNGKSTLLTFQGRDAPKAIEAFTKTNDSPLFWEVLRERLAWAMEHALALLDEKSKGR